VLGTLKDDNMFFPHNVNEKMFETNHVEEIACGAQHVVALARDGSENPFPQLIESLREEKIDPKPVVSVKKQTPVAQEAKPEPVAEIEAPTVEIGE